MIYQLLTLLALSLTLAGCATADSTQKAGGGWLLDAPDDEARFERLQDYLGGFSSAMWEVGERFDHAYVAIQDENYSLAAYHWEKIADAVRNGYRKRPARQANADRMFLDSAWITLRDALATTDRASIHSEWEIAREACMACHVAEDVAYMNDQPLLRDRTFSPSPAQAD